MLNEDYVIDQSRNEEILSESLRTKIKAISNIIVESGSPLEGNLFFLNHRKREIQVSKDTDRPDEIFLAKRANFVTAIKGKNKLLEIGVNAGHSALLSLVTNTKLKYLGIDIARHSYTVPCADYLTQIFEDRFEIHVGDSAKVFPLISLEKLLDCDIIHIDGGHSVDMFTVDMSHAIMLPNPMRLDRCILVDDANAPHIQEKIMQFIDAGYLCDISGELDWQGRANIPLRVL